MPQPSRMESQVDLEEGPLTPTGDVPLTQRGEQLAAVAPIGLEPAKSGEPSARPPVSLDGIVLDKESNIYEGVYFSEGTSSIELVENILHTLKEREAVRLYLVEGVTQESADKCSKSDDNISKLFRDHCLNELTSTPEPKEYFFAKWPRLFHQTKDQWKIEAKIMANRPWDLESSIDPGKLCQSHEHYGNVSRVYRPHAPLEWSDPVTSSEGARDDGEKPRFRYLVSGECVSCYFKKVPNGFIGFIIFDRPPAVETQFMEYRSGKLVPLMPTTKPRFDDFVDCCNRFRKCLSEYLEAPDAASIFRRNPVDVAKNILLQLALEDPMDIFPKLHSALDRVDEGMSDNNILYKSILEWRKFFGFWRRVLRHDLSSIAYIKKILEHPIGTGHGESLLKRREYFKTSFETLQEKIKRIETDINSSFTAIMSTMSIVESQRAITQAEDVSKLTKLAFFFIPLTLSAGIFGMNIVEWQNKLKVSLWIAVSLTLTLVAYVALYFGQIKLVFSRGPSYTENLDRNNLSKTIDHQYNLLKYFFRLYGMSILIVAAYVIVPTGVSVGIWALATKAHLPPDDKAKVGFGLGVVLPLMLFTWPTCLRSSKRSRKTKLIAVLILGIIMACVAVGTWGILGHTHYSTSKKVSLSVFLAVFVLSFFSLITTRVCTSSDSASIVFVWVSVVLAIVGSVGMIWAIAYKSHLSYVAKIGVGFIIALFGSCVIFFIFILPTRLITRVLGYRP